MPSVRRWKSIMKKILIAEDESIIRMDFKAMLENHGYKVVAEANDGEKAIELAFEHRPDLILMDIKMPKVDGLKASKIIGEQLDLPIIIITAYSQKEFVEKAQQDNVVSYLVKPIVEANLIPAVEVAIHQFNKTKELKDNIREVEAQIDKRKLIERAKGILMDTRGLSEKEAFKMLRDTSMSRQLAMDVLAKEVIEFNK